MGQLFLQLGDFLADLQHGGRLQVRTGPQAGHPDRAVAAARAELDQAAGAADALYEALERAQSAIADLARVTTEAARPQAP